MSAISEEDWGGVERVNENIVLAVINSFHRKDNFELYLKTGVC